MTNEIILYHGTKRKFTIPNLTKSRVNIDFGKGFYCTEDLNMAKSWACNKDTSLVHVYTFNFDGLKIKQLNLDLEWLEMIKNNRLEIDTESLSIYNEYDVLIGPVANDKLFSTLNAYLDGVYTAEETLAVLNLMNYNYQVVLKSQKAIDQLHYQRTIDLTNTNEKESIVELLSVEQEELEEKISKILKDIRRRRMRSEERLEK